MKGKIQTLCGNYGFIRGDDGVGYFFLPSALQITQLIMFDDLAEGMKVEFESITHPKGPRAIEVLVEPKSKVALPDEVV